MPMVPFLGRQRRTSRQARVWSWVLGSILAFFFAVVATPKLMGLEFEREMFRNWGYPIWFMYAVGIAEALFALMLVLPRTRFWGACLICLEMVGAAFTHIFATEYAMLPMPLATFGAAFWLAWLDLPVMEQYRRPTRRPAPM